jgi:phosphoadenosine phosphosulfate reductase
MSEQPVLVSREGAGLAKRAPQSEAPRLDLAAVNRELEGKSPQAVLAWAVAAFSGSICLQSSMQRRSSAMMHMLWRAGLGDVPVLFVDTGLHFPETLQTRERLARRYGLNMVTVHPELTPDQQRAQHGCELWRFPETYELCCHLRKERPFVAAAKRYDAIISGLQRAEGGSRSAVPVVGWDPRIEAYTIHPLAGWSPGQLDAYIDLHDVSVHPLYAERYPSIGCAPCTTPVAAGEHLRAGRWRHIREALEADGDGGGDADMYCKINWIDRSSPTS